MIWLWIFLGIELLVALVLAVITASTVKLVIFWGIQFLNAQLLLLGWFICLSPRLAKFTWLWWNDEDGAGPRPGWWNQYCWLAWRNPVDNFKYVKWTQAPKNLKPEDWLKYKEFQWRGKLHYYKVGWMSNSFCCMSAGSGRGY